MFPDRMEVRVESGGWKGQSGGMKVDFVRVGWGFGYYRSAESGWGRRDGRGGGGVEIKTGEE